MQTKALSRIKKWISFALLISTVGVLIIYFGFVQSPNIYFKIIGIILFLLGSIAALIFGYGHRNGKKNVEKMIDILEQKIKKKAD